MCERLQTGAGKERDMRAELPASVPGPVPPDDRRAWYAPAVRSQYPVSNGVVATVTEGAEGYHYRVREPMMSESETETLDRVESQFETSSLSRPRTRTGAVERVETGLPNRLRNRIDELERRSPASRRRLTYHLLASLRSLGSLTPLAIDDRVRIADTTDDLVVVHTRDFAPAITDFPADTPFLDRFLGERVTRKSITFAGFEIPVTIVRGHLLGADSFDVSYVIEEPDLLPGDRELIETVSDRILEAPPDGVLEDDFSGVVDRARTLLDRRFSFRPLYQLVKFLPGTLGSTGSISPSSTDPTGPKSRSDRIDALAYYVTRDLVGDGKLTIPMRDPSIQAIEANRVGGRITVVSHRGGPVGDTRMPTTRSIDDTAEFVDLTRSLAAEGGVELSVEQPTATVTLERETKRGSRNVHCSVSLPDQKARGHVSIATEHEVPPTPVALVEDGRLSPELVAGIWTAAAESGTVLFLGPVDAEPTVALGAHTPFIPASDRPVAIGAGAPHVDLPHETALSIPNRDGSRDDSKWKKRIERDALHPDVAVLTGLNTPTGLEHLGTVLASGRPVFAAARIANRTLFSHLVREAGVGHQVRSGIDLVVELPPPEAEEPATGWVPVWPGPAGALNDRSNQAEPEQGIGWERFVDRKGADGSPSLSARFVDRLRQPASAAQPTIERTFSRRQRYVEYLETDGSTDRESLMGFLADLRTDEAATIERIQTRDTR